MGDPRPARGRTVRLFVALWPGDALRMRLVAERDRWTWSRTARPIPDANLHATLHFVGRVDRARLEEVAIGLVVPFAPFVLTLGTHALWRNGIAALEPASAGERLAALHRALGDALGALALPVETRAYRPHVTLARDADGSIAPSPASLALARRRLRAGRVAAGRRVRRAGPLPAARAVNGVRQIQPCFCSRLYMIAHAATVKPTAVG